MLWPAMAHDERVVWIDGSKMHSQKMVESWLLDSLSQHESVILYTAYVYV